MKKLLMVGALVTLVLIMLIGIVALADIAPPKTYVEDCTLDKVKAKGFKDCYSCSRSRREKNENKCPKEGYHKECKTYGGFSWTELWCSDEKNEPIKEEPIKEEPIKEEPIKKEPIKKDEIAKHPDEKKEGGCAVLATGADDNNYSLIEIILNI